MDIKKPQLGKVEAFAFVFQTEFCNTIHPSKSGVKPRYHREHFFQHIAVYALVRFDVLRLALECLFTERFAVETHIVKV